MLPCLVRGLFLRSAAAPSGPNKHLTHTRVPYPGPPTPNLAEGSGAIVYTGHSGRLSRYYELQPPSNNSSGIPGEELALNHPRLSTNDADRTNTAIYCAPIPFAFKSFLVSHVPYFCFFFFFFL